MSSPMGPPIESDDEVSPIASLISVAAVLLIFVTDLHHELFRGLASSYNVLPVDHGFDARLGLVQLTDQASKTFVFTLRIAAPFMAFSIIATNETASPMPQVYGHPSTRDSLELASLASSSPGADTTETDSRPSLSSSRKLSLEQDDPLDNSNPAAGGRPGYHGRSFSVSSRRS